MTKLFLTRLLDAIPTLFLVLSLVFITLRLLPGDPAIVALGEEATAQQLEQFRQETGLDQPILQQYVNFMIDVVTLDFGQSLISNVTVAGELFTHLPYTIELAIASTLVGTVIGIPMGIWAAIRKNKLPDQSMRVFSLVGYAIPDFYLAAMLLVIFALNLGWFPINGAGDDFVDRLYHLVLPAATLAFLKIAFIGRLTRTSVLEVMSKDYVRTARAKGAPETRIIIRHTLRNAMMPVTTALGLSILATISGAVSIELVFNRPGIGQLLISAIAQRDYPMVQGGVVVVAVMVVLINLIIDLLYLVVDPRQRSA